MAKDKKSKKKVKPPIQKRLPTARETIASRKRAERCQKLKKKRHALVEQRRYWNKKLDVNLTKAQAKRVVAKVDRISQQIADLQPKIYKCGKKYEKLRRALDRLNNRRRYLKRLLKDRSLSKTARNKLYVRQRNTISDIVDLKRAMGFEVMQVKGRVMFAADEVNDITYETMPVWRVRENVEPAIGSGDFDTIEIDGEVYSVNDTLVIKWALDDFIADIQSVQHLTRTPMVDVVFNVSDRVITVKNHTF